MLAQSPGSQENQKPRRDHSGERSGENPQAQLYAFRAVYVFNISQSEGKELPELTEVEGEVTGYRERLAWRFCVHPQERQRVLGRGPAS